MKISMDDCRRISNVFNVRYDTPLQHRMNNRTVRLGVGKNRKKKNSEEPFIGDHLLGREKPNKWFGETKL